MTVFGTGIRSTSGSSAELIRLQTITADELERYARVSIAFTVASVLRVEQAGRGLGELVMHEVESERPYEKDYDVHHPPTAWRRFDLSRWRFRLALESAAPVGASTVALPTPGVDLFRGRDDVAILWDLRVGPASRGRGLGARLFDDAVDFARSSGCRQLLVETQNINVPACRFYAARGSVLAAMDRDAYRSAGLEHEVQLLWRLDL